MAEIIYKAARLLGIETAVGVSEINPLHPRILVTVGQKTVVCDDIDLRWLMDSELKHIKTVLADMYRTAKNN